MITDVVLSPLGNFSRLLRFMFVKLLMLEVSIIHCKKTIASREKVGGKCFHSCHVTAVPVSTYNNLVNTQRHDCNKW